MRFVCFDVETPNHLNERMSSVGVAVVEDRMIVDEFYTLINPEQPFDEFNVGLTHISPEAVKNAPTFLQAWETLGGLLKSGLLVAHNAQFDMSVLSKCLKAYRLPRPDTEYLCTCRMGKKLLPYVENHKLDTICRDLMIPLDHHNALSDARACAEILIYYIDRGADPREYVRPYSLKLAKTLKAPAYR